MELSITSEGLMKFVWTDKLASMRGLGQMQIERASHVEPNADGLWEADMSPVSGPVLGPFETRTETIDAELFWIRENLGL